MNVAKWLILALLALPLAELAAFIAVAATIGFVWALALVLAGSLTGVLVLRHAGGNHIARVRVAMSDGGANRAARRQRRLPHPVGRNSPANSRFITDVLGLAYAGRTAASSAWPGAGPADRTARRDGIVDLEPEQWRRVPDPALAGPAR